MNSLILYKILAGILIYIVTLAAGWLPFQKRHQNQLLEFPLGETLATGVFLGAGLLHMLPESQELFQKMGYHYPFAYLCTGIVFLFFLWLEHIGKELYHHNHRHPAFAMIAVAMLSLHSFMLGAALGINDSRSLMLMLFLAIITHKWAESFAISVQLNKSSLHQSQAFFFFGIFSIMTPLGICLGWYFDLPSGTSSLATPFLLAASAGTFLYLGTLHGLERCVLVERCCNLRDFSFVIIGFLVMGFAAVYL
jgi:zinc transporter ZupT